MGVTGGEVSMRKQWPLNRTTFYRTMLVAAALALAAPTAQAASIDTGALFESGARHIAFGKEPVKPHQETRIADGRYAGRNGHRLVVSGGSRALEATVPEPGAALLFGLGAL